MSMRRCTKYTVVALRDGMRGKAAAGWEALSQGQGCVGQQAQAAG